MIKIIFFICLLFTGNIYAQEVRERPDVAACSADTAQRIFTKAEFPPKFNGSFLKFLEQYLRYPDSAQIKGVQGVVLVEFLVHKDGTVTDVKLSEKSPQKNKWLANETIRILKLSNGKWLPAIQNYVLVDCYHQQQINFVLAEQ